MHSVVIVTVSDSDSQATHCFQYLLRLWASSPRVIPGWKSPWGKTSQLGKPGNPCLNAIPKAAIK